MCIRRGLVGCQNAVADIVSGPGSGLREMTRDYAKVVGGANTCTGRLGRADVVCCTQKIALPRTDHRWRSAALRLRTQLRCRSPFARTPALALARPRGTGTP